MSGSNPTLIRKYFATSPSQGVSSATVRNIELIKIDHIFIKDCISINFRYLLILQMRSTKYPTIFAKKMYKYTNCSERKMFILSFGSIFRLIELIAVVFPPRQYYFEMTIFYERVEKETLFIFKLAVLSFHLSVWVKYYIWVRFRGWTEKTPF